MYNMYMYNMQTKFEISFFLKIAVAGLFKSYNFPFFIFKDYHLKDVDSVAKVLKHSNCVINLIGRQFETRWVSDFNTKDIRVETMFKDLCNLHQFTKL